MKPAAPRFVFLLAVALLCAAEARALIIYGSGPNDLGNAVNATSPPNGAPWPNVVQFGANNASGIYLGHGYVLTANHVNLVDSGILINGVNYSRDTGFAPVQISEDVAATGFTDIVDLKIVKIVGAPPLPVVQHLAINFSATADLAMPTTFIGWGVGKGTVATDQGWEWGDDSTRAQRWGLNSAPGPLTVSPFVGYPYHYDGLYTQFNRALGGSTPQVTLGDSGSGLFQSIDGVWKLSGIATLADSAYFDSDLDEAGDQPDNSYFLRLKKYAYLLRYENWAAAKLGNSTASLTADPDKDGLSNLLEYAFHLDPNSAASTGQPQAGMEAGYATLTYPQLLSATDLTYAVEETASLSPAVWTPAMVIEETVSTSGVTRVVKAKVALNGALQKYLRLSVVRLQ